MIPGFVAFGVRGSPLVRVTPVIQPRSRLPVVPPHPGRRGRSACDPARPVFRLRHLRGNLVRQLLRPELRLHLLRHLRDPVRHLRPVLLL
jgi:hypothetical protein